MRREAILVLTAVFLLVFGAVITGTIITPYARSLGAPWPVVGLLTAAMYVIRLCFGAPIGRLADRKGPAYILHLSLMLYPPIAVVYWLAGNVYTLIGARLLHGVASAMLLPMAMAYIGALSPPGEEGRYMGFYNTAYYLANGLAPVAATAIVGYYHAYRPTFVALFLFALLALAMISATRLSGSLNQGPTEAQVPGKMPPIHALIRDESLLAVSALQIALAVVSGLIGFFLLPFMQQRGLALILTGSVVSAFNLLTGLMQVPGGRMADRVDKDRLVLLAGLTTAAALCLFPLAGNTWVMAGVMLAATAGSALLLAAASALATEVGRRLGMGGTMGFINTSYSAGMVLGCIALGLAPGRGGLDGFFYLAGGVTAACIGAYAFLRRLGKGGRRLGRRRIAGVL